MKENIRLFSYYPLLLLLVASTPLRHVHGVSEGRGGGLGGSHIPAS